MKGEGAHSNVDCTAPLKDQNQEKFLWGNLGPMGVYRRESRYHGEICSLFFCAMPTARDTAGANF